MGAGKSTRSVETAKELNAVLLSEDMWLEAHYPGRITDFNDYVHYSAQIRPFVRSTVQAILKTGANVVLDFPGNTRAQRAWHRETAATIGARHLLVYLQASDMLCLRRLEKRRTEQPERAGFDNPEVFHAVTRHFEEPAHEENLNINRVTVDD